MRKVLVPLDKTSRSKAILGPLKELFGPGDVQIILLRVAHAPAAYPSLSFRPATAEVPIPLPETGADMDAARGPSYDQEMAALENRIRDELEEIAADLRRQGFDVKTVASLGTPAAEIITCAKQEGVDMVALATRARTGIDRLIHGSVARAVVESLEIPILLLRVPEEKRSAEEQPRLPGVELKL